jgi:tetratricopeptide (TPR) repeat protein
VSKTRHYLFQTRDQGRIVSVNQMVVEHVILNNRWERPIYFSSNPTNKSRLGLGDHARIVGQVYEAVRETTSLNIEYETTAAMLDTLFQFRGYDDPTIALDDNAVGLSVAFPEKMLAVAEHYRRVNDTAEWVRWSDKMVETFPYYNRVHENRAALLRIQGDTVAADAALQTGIETINEYVERMPTTRFYWYFLARMKQAAGEQDGAIAAMETAYYLNPYEGIIFQDYVSLLTRAGRTAEAGRAAEKWLEYYPSDQRARALVAGARAAGG